MQGRIENRPGDRLHNDVLVRTPATTSPSDSCERQAFRAGRARHEQRRRRIRVRHVREPVRPELLGLALTAPAAQGVHRIRLHHGRMPRSLRVLGAVLVVLVVLLVVSVGGGRLGEPEYAGELSGGASALVPDGPVGARGADGSDLGMALEAAGIELPPRTNLYAAVITSGADGSRRSDEFEAGGGAGATNFWPASSVKLLAAVGALEFLHERGFSGSASVDFGDGALWPVRELYRSAVVHSENSAYDALVGIAGVDWLNTVFLTPKNGFPVTVVQKAYADLGQVSTGPITVREGDRELELPSRSPSSSYDVRDDGNLSNLAEMTDSVRRVVLHDELPPTERFAIDGTDVSELRSDLLGAPGFIEAGADEAFGENVLVYSKPGHVVGADCVDVAYVQHVDGRAFLLGISTPDDGAECATLTEIARYTLEFLDRR